MLTFAQQFNPAHPASLAIQLGTGQSHSLDGLLDNPHRVSYADIFASATPSAMTHRGELTFGWINGCAVIVFSGRLHLYEGHSAFTVCQNIILAKLLGCQTMLLSNAAGALHQGFSPGEVVVISDHINLTGENPLIDIPLAIARQFQLEHPFVDMSQAYSPALIGQFTAIAQNSGVALKSCIYAGLQGPSLETSAERRMLAQLGADTVGMSTVNEVIMSHYLGLETVAFCTITNMATGGAEQQADTIESIIDYADRGGRRLEQLIGQYCSARAHP